MFIKSLKISNFRNLIQKEFIFNKNINIFYGINGVGKTSILEAINFLSSGKSFRKGHYKSLINKESNDLTVFIQYNNDSYLSSISVNKHKTGKWKAEQNQSDIKKQSQLSIILPVVTIEPEVSQLIDLGPSVRRSFLDWLVFHVKHDYLILWKKVNKCVKQLNNLYKNKHSEAEIKVWEGVFIQLSEELNKIRFSYFNKIKPYIQELSKNMQEDINDLSLIYKQGWSEGLTFSEQMQQDKEKNRRYGQLQHGPHKMDIKINIDNLPASFVLSRGQKKILSMSFYMAYIKLLKDNSIYPVVCLDDFDAELDNQKLKKVAEFFQDSQLQLFVTTVHKKKITKAFTNYELFHVKHN